MPPPAHEGYPTRDDVLDYLARYEARYEFPIKRPVRVESIERAGDRLAVVPDKGRFAAQAVVSATGPWRSEERRVGNAFDSTFRSRWSPYHEKKNNHNSTTYLYNTPKTHKLSK